MLYRMDCSCGGRFWCKRHLVFQSQEENVTGMKPQSGRLVTEFVYVAVENVTVGIARTPKG
jgi:hypothetical protein